MTPQELKNSILQLAIQGKLVEQRPEEGTAEELYQQIQAEKKKLMKEGKIKKDKLLPEITEDEIPFDIPDSWKWVYISGLGDVVGGGTPKTGIPEFWDDIGGFPWLTPADMKFLKGKYAERGERNISPIGLEKSSAKLMPKGSILYSSRAPIGYIAIAANDISTNQGFKSLVPTIMEISEYMYYCLVARTNDIISRASGTTFKEISGANFSLTQIPLPPLAEQKRIVAKIEELLPYIDRYEEAWNKLEDFNKRFPTDMQKSILQMAIQGKLVEQRPEEGTAEELYQQIQFEKKRLIKLGELRRTKSPDPITNDALPFTFPKSWKVCYIDDIAFVTKLAGFEYTKNIAPNLSATGIPLFKGKNVQNGSIVLDFESYIPEAVADELPRSQIRKKCLLTPYVGTIGNIAIFDGSFRAHLGSNVGKIELLNSSGTHILEEYVLYYLISTVGYSELTKYKKATAQESISIDAIRNVIIAIPPLAEQKRIVAKLEEILPMCEKLSGGHI